MSQRRFWLFSAGIVLFGLLIRLFQFGAVPVSLYWDEMAMYVDVKSILATGKDMHGRPWTQIIYPSYGDYKLAPTIWLAFLSSKLLGLSEMSIRLPSLVAGVFTILISGGIAWELSAAPRTEKKRDEAKHTERQLFTLFAMGVVTILPWSIQFSRASFEGHIAQSLVALSVWFGLKAANIQSRWRWVILLIAVLVGALATYTYYSVRFVWPAVAIGVVLWQWGRSTHFSLNSSRQEIKASLKEAARLGSVAVGVVLLYLATLVPLQRAQFYTEMNTFRLGTASILNNETYIDQANLQRQAVGNHLIDRVLYRRQWFMLRELAENYSAHLTFNYLFLEGDPNLRHGTGYFGELLLIMAIPLLVGIYVGVKKNPAMSFLLIGWWFAALLPASIPTNVPHALRSLNALVPVTLLVAYGGVESWKWLQARPWPQVMKAMFAGIFALLFAINFSAYALHYFVVYPRISADDWQSGYQSLARSISNEQVKHPQLTTYMLPFDDRFYLWLMGYGHVVPAEFQLWQSQNFHYGQSVPRVKFEQPSRFELQKNEPLLIAGKVDQLKEFAQNEATPSAHFSEIHLVSDEVGRHNYGYLFVNN